MAENPQNEVKIAKEDQLIQENLKTYLSRADQFATRVSVIFKSRGDGGDAAEQQNLFVDSHNVNLRQSVGPKKKEGLNMLPFILMIALSVHSIFEGIALGLMNEMGPFINLMISILMHKFAESMSISIAMQKSGFEFRKLFWFIFLFSFATPIGTLMGILLNDADEIVNIVFTSLAGGSFIYVSCSELIVEEFSLPGNRWWKLLAFVVGAVFIGLLLLLE
jgi:zinc transporter 1/2/3